MERIWRGYRVTSEFGNRDNPLTKEVDTEFHKGIDLVLYHKAPIRCFKGGRVLYAGFGKTGTGLGNYGNVIVIEVDGKAHLYAHLDSVCVAEGYYISDNHLIGYQGATGGVAGSHLHFEVRKTNSPKYGWSATSDGYIRPDTYIDNLFTTNVLTYKAHVQNKGWLSEVGENEVAGTTGQSLRMEGLIVNLEGIQVQAHVQGIGWQQPVSSGQVAGIVGQSLRMEAVKLWLTGELAKTHDIVYRVHVQGKGWLQWVKNDSDYAGTVGKSLRMEAIQIKLVMK